MAAFLASKNITPNQLTLGGLGLSLLAGVFLTFGQFLLAGIVGVFSCLGDMLDGALARTTGKSSKFGAFLDSTADRYGDVCIFGGLVLYYAGQGRPGMILLSLAVIAGSYATSYTKARSENFIDSCDTGIFERPERMIAMGFFAFIPPLREVALWVLALGTNFTAFQRISYTEKKLRNKLSVPSTEN